MKKSFRLLVAAALFAVMSLSGAAQAAEYVLKVAYENHPDSVLDREVKYWAELLEKRSNGRVKIERYPSSQLGTKQEVLEQAQLGANVAIIADAGFLGEYVPDFTILSGPYFADWDKLFKLLKTDWFKGLEAKLADKGLEGLAYNWMYGSRSLVANKPVNTPKDMEGLKIRVPGSKIQIEAFKAMGATPTPMPLGEVYPALTQKVIDGAENPLNVLYEQKLYEPTKNLSLLEYLNMNIAWMAGKAYLDTLPADVKQLLKETCEEAGLYSHKLVPEEDAKLIKKMEQEGVKIIKVDKAPFREASKATYTKFPEWTPGLYENVQKLLETL